MDLLTIQQTCEESFEKRGACDNICNSLTRGLCPGHARKTLVFLSSNYTAAGFVFLMKHPACSRPKDTTNDRIPQEL
jgi:hypothetical protein